MGNRDRERNRIGSGESERESLLINENTPKYIRQKSLHVCADQAGNKNRMTIDELIKEKSFDIT